MEKKKFGLTSQIIVATVLGIIFGLIFGEKMENISFLGDIFLRLIQMPVVILIMTSIIESVGGIEPKDLGKIGAKAIVLFFITTTLSAIVGILLVNIIKPGVGISHNMELSYSGTYESYNFKELLVNFFPKNIFQAMSEGNIIQCVIFSILTGLSISTLGDNPSAKRIYTGIISLNRVTLQVIKFIISFAPIGIFALLAKLTGTVGFSILLPLLKYLLAIAIGSFTVLTLFIIFVSVYGGINPIKILKGMKNSIIISVTTTSSAVSLPVQMDDSENNLGVDPKISKLVNSLAMSLNSDGLALTLSISCLMIAQFFGIELSLQNQLLIVFVSVVSTIGNLLVPGGALVALAIALNMTNLPIEGVALLAGVDWFAGIFRTLLNVVDDILCTMTIAISEKKLDKSKISG